MSESPDGSARLRVAGPPMAEFARGPSAAFAAFLERVPDPSAPDDFWFDRGAGVLEFIERETREHAEDDQEGGRDAAPDDAGDEDDERPAA